MGLTPEAWERAKKLVKKFDLPPDHEWLLERLTERNAHPENAAQIDQEIWEKCGENCAILVSDTSGFTRITKERGVLHFLALVEKGVSLSRPIIECEQGILLKQEADNMLCLFPTADGALRVAVGVVKALRVWNAGVEDPDSHVAFCFGVGYGKVLRLTDEVFGDEMNVASKLGEDTAGREEILLSKAAAEALTGPVEGVSMGEWETVHTGNLDLPFRKAVVL